MQVGKGGLPPLKINFHSRLSNLYLERGQAALPNLHLSGVESDQGNLMLIFCTLHFLLCLTPSNVALAMDRLVPPLSRLAEPIPVSIH